MSARYTCEIIFHRATNIPIADLNGLSSDPYLSATLVPLHGVTGRNGPPSTQSLSYRTPTIRHTLNPIFNARWLVSGIPPSGFALTLWLLDEDVGDHDDRLGRAVVQIPNCISGQSGAELSEGWDSGEVEYKVHKRYGSWRTRLSTYLSKVVTHGRVRHPVRVVVSVRVLGLAPPLGGHDADPERVYTLGPHVFARHSSPLAARLASVQSFKATRLQLAGPVPAALCHRYVGYRMLIKAIFRASSIEGIVLHHALHKEHRAIYRWDKWTVCGVVGDGKDALNAVGRPDEAFARTFLDLVEYGTEGRIFTYVIMLDGQWRFTETGAEFAIDLLSKHTTHSDVAPEVAFSGEFFVRLLRRPHRSRREEKANGHASPIHLRPLFPDDDVAAHPPETHRADDEQDPDPRALPPSAYELVIDNDSGTYQPHKDLLPVLQAFLARPANLGALGRVRACDRVDERLVRWKDRRREEKRRARGARTGKGKEKAVPLVRRASVSSSSGSSDAGTDAVGAAGRDPEKEREKTGEQEGQVRGAIDEVARGATENGIGDPAAGAEERGEGGSKAQIQS